jgi:serine/threonine protein kinase
MPCYPSERMVNDPNVGPKIEGLSFIGHLGTGGYSDVYLYEQRRPRMRVAVKVLNDARLSDSELAQFAAEAETMAELADHPYIVQVFSTGSTQDGRPYLVMKYYPPPNLGKRAATERLTVAEVLRTGIQISSAVEAAHRAGILHRDIKPANILVSQYGEPGLADFGIAGKTTDSSGEEDLGVSIPWSPPEVLSGASNGSVASDVYSLAATLWHLLAGRSPHEAPGGDNSPRALMGRILRSAPPATGRADAPASLDRLLQQSMSKNPQMRPGSALEFARLLQGIEQELRYARTPIVVDGTAAAAPLTSGATHAVPADAAAPSTPPAQPGHLHEPATTQRPVRPAMPRASEPQVALPNAAQEAPSAREALDPSTTRRPERPRIGSLDEAHPSRFAPSAGPASETDYDRLTLGAQPQEGTRLRPAVATPQLGSVSGGRVSEDPPPTTRRPVSPSVKPVPPPPKPRRLSPSALILAAVATGVLAVIIAVLLLGKSNGGNRPDGGSDTPSGPVGSNQAGFGSTAVVAPKVRTSYDTSTRTLTFTWTAASATSRQYVYSLNGKAQVGPTSSTSIAVKTASPNTVCIVVGTVGSDGIRHLAAPVCG